MKYETLIFDLDGTLYYQLPLRIYMIFMIFLHFIVGSLKLREIFVLKTYRKLREKLFAAEHENFGIMQISEAAKLCGVDYENAEKIINLWLIEKPLNAIKIFRRKKLLEAIKIFQSSGKIIIVYSDYPVQEKLNALKILPDYSFWSSDKLIKCMKPNSTGLINIINNLKLNRKYILYVGDRYDRDGICAKNSGVDYMGVREFEKKFC